MYQVPDAAQLSRVMAEATAPAFVLGAVAAFVSALLGRMTSVIDRIRSLHEIADDDDARAHLRSDIPQLRRRARICTAQCCWRLPAEFARRWLQHIFGAAVLFALAVGLLGGSLFRFGQEVRIGVSEADHYR